MGKSKISSEILFTQEVERKLSGIVCRYPKGKIFLATENNVKVFCLPKIKELVDKYSIRVIIIPEGESNKKLESVTAIWKALSINGADRKSLLINLGGGMLTDLAGFAASTFKRGIDFVNIPTTLLSQVDASVGGKTGFNFNGLKNEIGTFKNPISVIINTDFLKTIDKENLLSGYAEMIKHGLIFSPAHLRELEAFDLEKVDYTLLQEIIRHSVNVKEYFVENDPTEMNIRKALNFGHTTGHAFESFAMKQKRPVLHGYAVAYGMIMELYLSAIKCNLNKNIMSRLANWLLSVYGKFEIQESDFEQLFELMTHDKKNEKGKINFTLISEIGKVEINQDCGKELILEALRYYKSL